MEDSGPGPQDHTTGGACSGRPVRRVRAGRKGAASKPGGMLLAGLAGRSDRVSPPASAGARGRRASAQPRGYGQQAAKPVIHCGFPQGRGHGLSQFLQAQFRQA